MTTVKYSFVALFPPFAAGILLSVATNFSFNYLPFILIFIILLSIFLPKSLYVQKNHIFGIIIYVFFFILGAFVVDYHKVTIPENITSEKAFYVGVVDEPPKIKEKSVQTIIKIEAFKDSSEWIPLKTKIVLYIQKDSISETIKYGDRIVFNSTINTITNAGNPLEFNYKSYMANQGIYFTSYSQNNQFKILEHNQGKKPKWFALTIRDKLLNIYSNFEISDQSYGVLSALTLGYRDEVDNDTRQMFANTGAMHILAVSGLHVGIIYMILNSLLGFMDKKRKLLYLKSVIIILMLWLFALIAGLSPSVKRSALMFSLFVVGRLLMRSTSIYNVIFATAFILLLFNPLDIYSVGFQLSYAAVLSIVFFQPYIYKLFFFQRYIPDKIWALLSVSIAAQMGTMPIGLFYFHQFPNYFFLTNVLVIPLASIILYLAILLFAVSWIPILSGGVAFLLKVSLKILLSGVGLINSLPFATTQNVFITPWQTVVLFIVVISFSLFWIYNKKELLYGFLISFLAFLTLNFIVDYKNATATEIVIFNTRNAFTMNVLNNNNTVIADDSAFGKSNSLDYSCKPYWLSKRSTEPVLYNIDSLQISNEMFNPVFIKNNFVQIGNTRFMIVRNSDVFDYKSLNKIKVDYIVLTKNVYLDIEQIIDLIDFKMIVFDGSNKYYRIEKWTQQCDTLGLAYYDVSSQGALRIDYETSEIKGF